MMISTPTQRKALALQPLVLASAIAVAFPVAALAETAPSQVVVTATRMATPASDVLSDNDLISTEEIAAAGQVSVAELLQKHRGVEISSNGGSGSYASVFLRGASNYQSIVLVDGVRIGASTTGGATWSTIPLSQVDHIEIIYGPLSSLYGADAMGGVIQIFTKRGNGYMAPTVSAGVGSYGRRQINAGVSGSTQGANAVRYALNIGSDRSDEFSASTPVAGPYTYNRDRDGYKRNSASGSVSMNLAKGHDIGASFMHSKLNIQFDAGPGFNDHSEEKLDTISAYTHNEFVPGWLSKLQVSHAEDKNASIASYGNGFANTEQDDLSWQNDINLGGGLLQLVAEYRTEDVDADTKAMVRERSTRSYAAAYQFKAGEHLATVSARNDNNSQFGSHTTGSLAYGYRISNALRASVSAGTSFRAPSINELYYPGYGVASNKAEKGRNLEAGLVYADGKNQLSASLFRNRLTDLLVYAPTCPTEKATHPYGCAYNIDQATLSGLSIGGSTSVDAFTLHGALDFQDPKDDTTGKRLARRAKQHGSLVLDYTNGAFKGSVESVFSSSRFNDGGEFTRLGAYGVVNLQASYALSQDWSLFARWNNAAGKKYELAQGYATAGSNVFVGVRYGIK
jgi:vitamin B12 transporter